MATMCTKIIQGEIPCYKIVEDERFFAFLDISPLAKGHTLVIPKKETDYIFDIADAELADMMVFAKNVAKAIEKVVPCRKMGLTIIGLEVPHAHIHLIPINTIYDMDFKQQKLKFSAEEFESLASQIRAAL